MIPARYKESQLTDFEPEKINPILEWIVNDKKEILFINGISGCGKTHLMCAICNRLNAQKIPAAYVLIPDIALQLRDSMHPDPDFDSQSRHEDEMEIINKYRRSDLVGVFDDLGASKPSDYVSESLYAIINNRYEQIAPSVYSSNLTVGQISEIYGDRIASRLASGVVFKMNGGDRRLKKNERT
jgi:DNA replication protein DnaC